LFLARGLDVVAWDPAPGAEARLRARIAAMWPQLVSLGVARREGKRDRLRIVPDAESAVSQADFVQESAPDDEVLKAELLARLSRAAPPDTVIATSSSGLLPSRLASKCVRPGRIVVGHPLVPTHLMPLVEIVGGEQTEALVIEWCTAFYGSLGKRPLRLARECDGYVANRLQRALFSEAIRLVEDGVCTFDDIDAVVTTGFGLRTPVLGPVLHRHLAGGSGGVHRMLAHFGWHGSDRSAAALISAVENRWGGKDIADLERWRDEALVRIMKALRPPP
jgi:3-hydroxyacyl-CoA dehydrogenase